MQEQMRFRDKVRTTIAVAALGFVGIAGCSNDQQNAPASFPQAESQPKTVEEFLEQSKQDAQVLFDQTMQRLLSPACNSAVAAGDCDVDGIANALDKRPYVSDPVDLDGDGIPNYRDVSPYISSKQVATTATATMYNKALADQLVAKLLTRESLLTKDSDGDKVPDHLDRYYGDDYGDSDRDGLKNADDPAPTNPDRDRDGSLDGYDKEPNNPNVGKLADKRAEEKRLEEKRQAEVIAEKRQQDLLQQQREQRERDEERRLLQKQQQRMDEERRLRERER